MLNKIASSYLILPDMDGGGGVLLVVEADVVYGILVFHAIIQKHQLQICIVKIKLRLIFYLHVHNIQELNAVHVLKT